MLFCWKHIFVENVLTSGVDVVQSGAPGPGKGLLPSHGMHRTTVLGTPWEEQPPDNHPSFFIPTICHALLRLTEAPSGPGLGAVMQAYPT